MKKLKAYVPPKVVDQIGISQFSRTEFDLLKQTSKDRDGLDDNYEEYVANVANVKRNMKKMGFETVDVPLTVAEIENFCQTNGLENIGATRAQIVQMKLSGQL